MSSRGITQLRNGPVEFFYSLLHSPETDNKLILLIEFHLRRGSVNLEVFRLFPGTEEVTGK